MQTKYLSINTNLSSTEEAYEANKAIDFEAKKRSNPVKLGESSIYTPLLLWERFT